MRKERGFFLLILMVFFLAGGSFHHHADGHSQEDCSVCSLGVQNAAYLCPLVKALNLLFAALLLFFLSPPFHFISALSKVFSIRAPPALLFSLS